MVLLLCLLLLEAAFAGALVHLDPSSCSEPGTTPTFNSVLQQLASGETSPDEGPWLLESGEHCVRNYSLLQDLSGVAFQGAENAVVKCAPGNGMAFFNISNLHLSNLIIDGCGLKGNESLSLFLETVRSSIDFFFTLSSDMEQYVAMALCNCTDFEMENTIIRNTAGLGLLAINLLGESTLDNVTFENNVPAGCFQTNSFNLSTERTGGGALFYYVDYYDSASPNNINLRIVGANFSKNSYCGYGVLLGVYAEITASDAVYFVGGGGGLSFVLTQLSYRVNISVSDSGFFNNTALYGGGAHVDLFAGSFDSRILFDGCVFESNGVDESLAASRNYISSGSAFSIFRDLIQPDFNFSRVLDNYIPSHVQIANSLIQNNTAFSGTFIIFSLFSFGIGDQLEANVIFKNSTFQYNRALTAPGLYVQESKGTILQKGMTVLLKDTRFDYNSLFTFSSFISPSDTTYIGVVVIDTVNVTFAGKNSFSHNTATALALNKASIHVTDNLTIYNNTATYGGGISLRNSYLTVGRNSTLRFSQNVGAISGGAIFVDYFNSPQTENLGSSDCFIYIGDLNLGCFTHFSSNCPDITKQGAEIIFDGNQSPLGSILYGSTLNTCPWSYQFRENYAPGQEDTNLLELLYQDNSTFKFDSIPRGVEIVTTPATHITVTLPGQADSTNGTLNLRMAPGITRLLNVSTLDAFNQHVPAVITSLTLRRNTSSTVGETNFEFLNYNTSVQNTEFLVRGELDQPPYNVSLLAVTSYTQVNVMVSITEECPDGYYPDNDTVPLTCTCSPTLRDKGFNCTDDGQLLVPYGSWIGRDSNDTLVLGECPLDFCGRNISIIPAFVSGNDSMNAYDGQCNTNYNRSGVSCGSCNEGYSTVLGSNRCHKCSNTYLLLLLLFGAYGIFLIAAISFLQFTISEGFLNGLLFFSNVFAIYGPNYLGHEVHRYYIPFLWLSFKVGFEICLFDGMTALSSAALNYVFPLYLYLLLVAIILLARWSSKFSRWLGHSGFTPTKLFATILVMTYNSLLENSVSILAFTRLRVVETNASVVVWRYDPSVEYFNHYISRSIGSLGHLAAGVLPHSFSIHLVPWHTLHLQASSALQANL